MNILIVGCGRVGANLARLPDTQDNDVVVLAAQAEDLDRLSAFPDYVFGGVQLSGIPMDADVLKGAGIEDMDAVACMTDNDNINHTTAQIARTVFHRRRVVCRVSDPEIKEVYTELFGLQVVCPTNLTVESAADVLLEDDLPTTLPFGCSTAGFLVQPVLPEWIGHGAGELPSLEGKMLFGVLQGGLDLHLSHTADFPLTGEDKLVWAELLD